MLEMMTALKKPTASGNLPGPPDLIYNYVRPDGSGNNGYYGTFVDKEWLTYSGLRNMFNVKGSTWPAYETESSWMKFNLDGKILYVSKKIAGYSLDYKLMKDAGIIDGSGPPIQINGVKYKVRLLVGTNNILYNTGDVAGTVGCEYNRTIYNVSSTSGLIEEGEKFASFSNADLGLISNGSMDNEMCQGELRLSGTKWTIVRVKVSASLNGYNAGPIGGWRPCLEVIE